MKKNFHSWLEKCIHTVYTCKTEVPSPYTTTSKFVCPVGGGETFNNTLFSVIEGMWHGKNPRFLLIWSHKRNE